MHPLRLISRPEGWNQTPSWTKKEKTNFIMVIQMFGREEVNARYNGNKEANGCPERWNRMPNWMKKKDQITLWSTRHSEWWSRMPGWKKDKQQTSLWSNDRSKAEATEHSIYLLEDFKWTRWTSRPEYIKRTIGEQVKSTFQRNLNWINSNFESQQPQRSNGL